MKKVTIFFMIFACLALFGFTKRPSGAEYERVEGLKPLFRPLYGAVVFNSQDSYNIWLAARSKPQDIDFDFKNSSLLGVWMRPVNGECLGVESIDTGGEKIVVKGFGTKCSESWTTNYIYYKIPKTDKQAELILQR